MVEESNCARLPLGESEDPVLTGPIEITQHACEQYVRRIDRTLSLTEAHDLLTQHAPHAAPMKHRTPKGDEQWRLDEPCSCILVIKRDDKSRGGARVVVTVLEIRDVMPDEYEYGHAPTLSIPRTRKERRARKRMRMRA